MQPEVWKKVEELVRSAQALPLDRRAEFLRRACPNGQLRAEIESLLAQKADSFLEGPPLSLQLPPGAKLAHFEIVEPLGCGGMGEVYRARDSRLKRDVAIKVLPLGFARDPDRIARFEREAHAASALNHPNIVSVFDIGRENDTYWIVSELVQGETLRSVIDRGSMTVRKAIEIASQIADGLGAAHSAGIVHRDVKPSNIMFTRDGRVKILDFGLAKREQAATDSSTRELTSEGTVLGTAGYMSPEQIRAQSIDHRSDIFSFGVIFFEMLSGKRAFSGKSSVEVMNAILKDDPPEMPASVPPALDRLVRRCLEKEPARRFQSAADLGFALNSLALVPVTTKRSPALKWASITASSAVAAGVLYWVGVRPQRLLTLWDSARSFANDSGLPTATATIVPFNAALGDQKVPTFSPDGSMLAYFWRRPHERHGDIYIQQIGSTNPLRVTTEPIDHFLPAFSPDGHYIAHLDHTKLMVIPVLGGGERKIANLDFDHFSLDYAPDGKSVAVCDRVGGLESMVLVATDTGEKRRFTTPLSGQSDRGLKFSPDGRRAAFLRGPSAGVSVSDIYVMPASGGEPTRLTHLNEILSAPTWTADSREIIFARGMVGATTLWRVSESGGVPQPVLGAAAADQPALSHSGHRLAYQHNLLRCDTWRLELFQPGNRPGRISKLIGSTRFDVNARYSPDSRKIAFSSNRSGSLQIWVVNADGSDPVPLTAFDATAAVGSPRWSPNGDRIAFDAWSEGYADIWVMNADGGSPHRLTSHATRDCGPSWSADGQSIYFISDRTGKANVWRMPASGGQAAQVTQSGGNYEMESPDGKFLYFSKGDEELWKMPVNGGKEMPAMMTRKGERIKSAHSGWSVVHDGIYFIRPTSNSGKPNEEPARQIQFFNFATKAVVDLARLPYPTDHMSSGISVSHDRRWILFSQTDQTGSEIMLVNDFR